jgi:hypothetical protein
MKLAILILLSVSFLVLLFDIYYTYIHDTKARRTKKTIHNEDAYLERYIEIENQLQDKGSINPSNN